MSTIDPDGVDWREEGKRYDTVHHRMLRVARIANGVSGAESLLDIGCCGGKLSRFLRDGIEYYGCDIVPTEDMPDDRFRLWNIERDDLASLNLDRSTFDLIVMSGLLEHVEDRRLVVGKARQLSAPGGRVLLTYANPQFMLYAMNLSIRENDAGWIKRLLKKREVLALFRSQGYELERCFHLSYKLFYPSIPLITSLAHPVSNQYIYVFKARDA